MHDPVKVALEASSLALMNAQQGTTWKRPEEDSLEWQVMQELLPTKETAAAIAAFLRALPAEIRGNAAMFTPEELAVAVERAVLDLKK